MKNYGRICGSESAGVILYFLGVHCRMDAYGGTLGDHIIAKHPEVSVTDDDLILSCNCTFRNISYRDIYEAKRIIIEKGYAKIRGNYHYTVNFDAIIRDIRGFSDSELKDIPIFSKICKNSETAAMMLTRIIGWDKMNGGEFCISDYDFENEICVGLTSLRNGKKIIKDFGYADVNVKPFKSRRITHWKFCKDKVDEAVQKLNQLPSHDSDGIC